MQLNKEFIHAFLNDEPLHNREEITLFKDYHEPDRKRKDIVKELLSQLEIITDEFPTFNQELWQLLFHEQKELQDKLIILPVVGTREQCIIQKENQKIVLLDLLYIADYTQLVYQMLYLIQNFLSKDISELLIKTKYPIPTQDYQQLLDYFTFTNGLTNYLAWNEAAENYKFYAAKYEPYKEKAFGMLAAAKEVHSKSTQRKILLQATQGDFWNRFPGAAGMFYFDDVFRAYGNKGIAALYQKGWQNFIERIFTS